MDLTAILQTLSTEIQNYEDGTDAATEETPTTGSMIADEVAFHLQEGLFNDDLKARLKLVEQITGYDVKQFLYRYPDLFSSALLDD